MVLDNMLKASDGKGLLVLLGTCPGDERRQLVTHSIKQLIESKSSA